MQSSVDIVGLELVDGTVVAKSFVACAFAVSMAFALAVSVAVVAVAVVRAPFEAAKQAVNSLVLVLDTTAMAVVVVLQQAAEHFVPRFVSRFVPRFFVLVDVAVAFFLACHLLSLVSTKQVVEQLVPLHVVCCPL